MEGRREDLIASAAPENVVRTRESAQVLLSGGAAVKCAVVVDTPYRRERVSTRISTICGNL